MSAVTLIHVEGWPLALTDGDEEPRVRDLDLAERLGYERPRDIRKLIARLIEEGKLPGIDVRATAARTSMPRGGERETTSQEYWLTEAQAVKVTAKSETAEADAVLDEVIHVFILARRGLLTAAVPSAQLPAASPRSAVLAAMAEGMRLAAAEGDVEAMKVANGAIYRLLGGARQAFGAPSASDGKSAIERSFAYIAAESAAGRAVRGRDALRLGLKTTYGRADTDVRRLLAAGLIEDRGTSNRPAYWASESAVAEGAQPVLDVLKKTGRPSQVLAVEAAVLAHIVNESAAGRAVPGLQALALVNPARMDSLRAAVTSLKASGKIENRGTKWAPKIWAVTTPAERAIGGAS